MKNDDFIMMQKQANEIVQQGGMQGNQHSSFLISHSSLSKSPGPIGVFDSGYGGLTILNSIRQQLPQYDYLYLGDNARAPYGPRSFDVVYEFTRQAVLRLFEMGCHLVILGCNTASAKALRTIQQNDLPKWDPERRVLGVIRPTAEVIGSLTKSRHVGILATEGTIKSESYNLEIQKLHPDITVNGVACPFWVPLVEYNEAESPGADYFVKKRIDQIMAQDPKIDAIILGCTHYPLLMPKILKYLPEGVRIISQGEYVASSLQSYLERHSQIAQKCSQGGTTRYLTTENPARFKESAQVFLNDEKIDVENITLA
jgi:glutamate racemase